MSAPLPRAKLAAILGLLGSDHDGEVLAAARMAERIRRAAGTTWPDLLAAPDPSPSRFVHWRVLLSRAQAKPELLSPWEAGFLASIARRTSTTPKQHAVLQRLAERAQCHARD
jgi:hypothetical protein